jgi:hypothetical protein
MSKAISLLGLAIVLGLALIFFAGTPRTGSLMAREGAKPQDCHTIEIALDEGYGVTRHSFRPSCEK